MTHEDILIKAGLNWKVETERLQTVESGILVPNKKALVRSDTREIVGTPSIGYQPYQNDELLELLFKITDKTGLEYHSGGMFKGGTYIWFQLKSSDLKLGNDEVKGYVSGFNSFDGRVSLAFGNSTLTVSCMNKWWAGYREVEHKFRHSLNLRERLDKMLKNVEKVLQDERKLFREIKTLSEVEVSPEVIEMVTRRLFDMDKEDKLDGSNLSTQKRNKLLRFKNDLEIELIGKENTLWGLFSGVTRYTTHDMKKVDNTESKMFGVTGVKERKIFKELVALV